MFSHWSRMNTTADVVDGFARLLSM